MPPVVMPPPELWLTHFQALITLGNVILLLCLLVLYVKNYEQIKSKFALGLIAFAILLLVQAVTSHPFIHLVWGFHRLDAVGLLKPVSEWFEFAALAILLYISLRPE